MLLRPIALSLLVAATATAITFTVSGCNKDAAESRPPEPTEELTAEPAGEPEAEAPEAAPEPEPEPEPEPAAAKDLTGVVGGLENGKTFAELLALAELDKELQSADVSLTLLVPTDDAFAKLPKSTLDKWKKNKDALQKALKYHFILGNNDAARIGNYRTAPTAAGTELPIKSMQDSDMTIGGARLVDINLAASNGMVHVIDKVLQPGGK